jgi:uncharacterized membrane protein YvlD (DUF360 family)
VEAVSPKAREGEGRRYIANFVVVCGLFGLVAAAIMYFDATSKGDTFLEDSFWIIIGATILGIITLIIGFYLYITSSKN